MDVYANGVMAFSVYSGSGRGVIMLVQYTIMDCPFSLEHFIA